MPRTHPSDAGGDPLWSPHYACPADWSLHKLLRHTGMDPSATWTAMACLASSWPVLLFSSRPFSNTLEAIVLALVLATSQGAVLVGPFHHCSPLSLLTQPRASISDFDAPCLTLARDTNVTMIFLAAGVLPSRAVVPAGYPAGCGHVGALHLPGICPARGTGPCVERTAQRQGGRGR